MTNLEGITTKEIIQARNEAIYKHPNLDCDHILEGFMDLYVDKDSSENVKDTCAKQINDFLADMVELRYSKECIYIYQKIWEALHKEQEREDNLRGAI